MLTTMRPIAPLASARGPQGPKRPATQAAGPTQEPTKLCKRCKQRFKPSENTSHACRFHPLNWSGGEKAKAIGFLRASDDPADSLAAVHGTGMMAFYDCCGADSYDAPGCHVGRHVAYGEEDEGVFLAGR